MLARLSHLKQRFSSAPRYQRLLSYAVAFYLIYLLLLGLALPYIAKTQGPQQLATLLGRPVLLADVKINPFTLHISLDGFAVLEKNQQKFATIDHASVELNFWRSLFNGSINLKMIKLDGVSVAVTQFTAGHFNFSDIISHIDAQSKTSAQKPSAPAATNEQSAALPHIQIADIAISNSAVSYNDKPTGMRLSYPDINISLANFNSLAPLDKDYNSFIINIKGADSSQLASQGSLQVTPLRVQGQLQLNTVKLTTFWPIIAAQLQAQLSDGVVNLASKYSFHAATSDQDALQFITTDGQFSLTDLRFTAADKDIISLPSLKFNDISLDLQQQQVTLASIITDGLQLHASVDKQGLDLVKLFTPHANQPASSAADSNTAQADASSAADSNTAQADASPAADDNNTTAQADVSTWLVKLGKFELSNYDLNINEAVVSAGTLWRINPVNISTQAISSDLSQPIAYQLALTVNDKGNFSSKGDIDVKQQAIAAQVDIKQLDLSQFQSYLSPYLNVVLGSGKFSSQGSLDANNKGKLQYHGDLQLEHLSLENKAQTAILASWQALTISDLAFDQQANRLAIEQLTLQKSYNQYTQYADKTNSFTNILVAAAESDSANEKNSPKTESATNADTTKTAANKDDVKKAMVVEINKITIDDSQVNYTDYMLKPKFVANVDKIDGSIGKISSTANKNAEINIKGVVNDYAPVSLTGQINPLIAKPYIDIALVFDNFELPSLTAYSRTYEGLDIDEGQLSLALKYKLENDYLDGSNHIFIDQLDMTDSISSKISSILPVTLAIPLLKNSSGAIDLDVNVSGNINDPSFNISEIILKSLSNIIIRAATSPFSLLASLVESTDDLDKIKFAAGSDLLTSAEQEKLNSLAKALAERPTLKLNIKGSYNQVKDTQALAEQVLNKQLSKMTGTAVGTTVDANNLPDSGALLSAIRQVYQQETGRDPQVLRDELAKQQPKLDNTALNQLWYSRLYSQATNNETVKPSQLVDLARSRAHAVKSYLRNEDKVSSGRLFILSHQKNVASDGMQVKMTLNVK